MDLSILIVNWNTKYYLKQCLDSIFRSVDGITFEVIVVDNNSSDGSAEMVNLEFKQVTLVKNSTNFGFNKANNQAILLAKGTFVLILNPDTIVMENALSRMVRFMRDNQDSAALGCRILNQDGSIHKYFRKIPVLGKEILRLILPERFTLDEAKTEDRDYEHVHEINVLSGCCMMIRKRVFEIIGMLDERFFMYGDDVDLSYQITRNKMKIFYIPDASIMHFMKGSSRQCKADMSVEAFKSMGKLLNKLYGNPQRVIYECCAVVISALKVVYYRLISFIQRDVSAVSERIEGHRGIIRYCIFGDKR